ncbi:hypothetical protein ACJ4V0_15815 [Phreatobacter sp. HK31-P]
MRPRQEVQVEKLTAKVTPFSSIVGGGLVLNHPDGRCVAVVALLNVEGEGEARKALTKAIAERVAGVMNQRGSVQDEIDGLCGALLGAIEWMSSVEGQLRDGRPFQRDIARYKKILASSAPKAAA